MKIKHICLLSVLMLASACLKEPNNPAPNFPYGKFVGKFTKIHTNPANLKKDTTTASLQLVMSSVTGFAVTGDTAWVHAGSKGDFLGTITDVSFIDVTASSPMSKYKTHLNGTYGYSFNGVVFQMKSTSGDTLTYQYDFNKVSDY